MTLGRGRRSAARRAMAWLSMRPPRTTRPAREGGPASRPGSPPLPARSLPPAPCSPRIAIRRTRSAGSRDRVDHENAEPAPGLRGVTVALMAKAPADRARAAPAPVEIKGAGPVLTLRGGGSGQNGRTALRASRRGMGVTLTSRSPTQHSLSTTERRFGSVLSAKGSPGCRFSGRKGS